MPEEVTEDLGSFLPLVTLAPPPGVVSMLQASEEGGRAKGRAEKLHPVSFAFISHRPAWVSMVTSIHKGIQERGGLLTRCYAIPSRIEFF